MLVHKTKALVTFNSIELYMLVHKTSVNILTRFEVIQSIFSDHKRIKQEASKIPRITPKIWKLKTYV